MARRCTQCPTSACGSGIPSERQPAIDRTPRYAGVVAAKRAGGRDRREDAVGVARVDDDGMQAHAARSRLPDARRRMAAQTGKLFPIVPAVGRTKERGIFDAGVDEIGIGVRRLEMPDARELPRMRRAVIPAVRPRLAVVDEAIAHRLPRLSAIVGSLHDLPEPTRRLRRVQPIGIGRRAFDVIDLPAAEIRAADLPIVALAVGLDHERAFTRTDEYAHAAHAPAPFEPGRRLSGDGWRGS